ncbi:MULTISPECIES: hypothetical protein [Sphingomonas]|uniref:hypothetical protein n=1 Tax=Sphingomonas TaxID=13687 RepID=UPI000DEEF40B|nr:MULTISPECIES: hypothetical protein [Sphingomonas]
MAEPLVATAALAQSGVYLPQAPQGPGGEDTIETSSGTRCRQSINSNDGYLDVGIAGATSGGGNDPRSYVFNDDRGSQGIAYARVTVPLGHKPTRLDCSKVYELELQKLREELALLRMNAR